MKAIRTVLACIRKADQQYNLINHGDKIVIGLSGGKDSIVLTYCLTLYQKFSHTDFTNLTNCIEPRLNTICVICEICVTFILCDIYSVCP